jgi:hypothetical protein
MGYDDPMPSVNRISEAAAELHQLISSYDYDSLLPPHFLDGFGSVLLEQADWLEALTEQFKSYVLAAERNASSGTPEISHSDQLLNWSAVSGIPVWKAGRFDAVFDDSAFADYTPAPAEAEIVIYLDKYRGDQLKAVQAAALRLGDELGYTDFILTDEVFGSVFRRFRGKLRTGLASDFVQQKMQALDERTSIEVVGRARAETDAIKAASAVQLITSLAEIPNAVVRVGGLLVIKQADVNGVPVIITRELSTREIRALECNPGIQRDPHGALQLLAAAVAQLEEDGHDTR